LTGVVLSGMLNRLERTELNRKLICLVSENLFSGVRSRGVRARQQAIVKYSSVMPGDTERPGSMQKPEPPPEGPLIRLVRLAARLTSAEAAAAAGISKARWSQVENGYEKRDGTYYPVSATDGLLARMAEAIGLSAARLAESGRDDAAAILREMDARAAETAAAAAPGIPADAPLCSLEREMLALSDKDVPVVTKALIINRHRETDPGHRTCRPLSEGPTDQKLAGLQA
jgi:transcriptional regulator with XRE-family HTH domain